MASEPSIASVEHGGFTITSNTASAEAITESFGALQPKQGESAKAEEAKPAEPDAEVGPDKDPNAVALGKKGAEAKAAKRAAEAKEAKKADKEADTEKPAAEPAEAKAEGEDEAVKAEAAEAKEETEERKSRSKQRVEEATREAAELKRQIATERAERERLAARLAALETPAEKKSEPVKTAADDDPEPKEEDFESYPDFVKAAGRWAARQEFKTQERQSAEKASMQAREGRIRKANADFWGRMGKASQENPEFQTKVENFVLDLSPSFLRKSDERLNGRHVASDELFKSEHAARLALHFSENPQEFSRIASLPSPYAIAREMAKLEARLDGATAGNPPPEEQPAPKPAISKANPPVRPVTGPPAVAEPGYRPGMSVDEYAKHWNRTQLPKFLAQR